MPAETSNTMDYHTNVTPYRSNWVLQMLLQLNIGIFIIWAVSYLFHMLLWVHPLWNIHGLTLLLALVLAICTEGLRLYAGYSINLCTGAATMWMIFTVMPCLLLPAMMYLRLAIGPDGAWLHPIWSTQFILIALESIVTFAFHLGCTPHQTPATTTNDKQIQ